VDVLVNNAGIAGARKSIFDSSQAEIMDTLNVNYFGVWNAPSFMEVGIIIPGFVYTDIGPKAIMQMGMSPDEFADRLLPQMKAGQFYLVGHSYNMVRITEEYEAVKAAFEEYAPRYEGDEKYDIR